MLDRVPTSRAAQAPWMAVLLLSVLAATSRAQTIEITPVAGYRIGGDEQYSGPGAMGPGTSQLLSQLDLRVGLSLRF